MAYPENLFHVLTNVTGKGESDKNKGTNAGGLENRF